VLAEVVGFGYPSGKGWSERSEANARLMALSPEMLEALRDAHARLMEWIGSDCECDNTHVANNTVCCLCQYAAIIAKVEGR